MSRSSASKPSGGRACSRAFPFGLIVLASLASAPPTTFADGSRSSSLRLGAPAMLEPNAGSLLVEYYGAFVRDRDVEAFRRNVAARYTEGTLSRLLGATDVTCRRGAVLALGLAGGYGCNATLAKALKDKDPTVRALADGALWSVWFRADSPENNDALEKVRDLIGEKKLAEAIDAADLLIARAPTFAEAYNQKAIARFFQRRYAESVEDCRKVMIHNPYHIGALSGMGQCQLRLGLQAEALKTFRKALEVQPYSEGLREVVAELETALERDR